MLQTYVCVRLRCTDCGRLLGEAAEGLIPAHYPTPDAALEALRRVGGWVGPGGCWVGQGGCTCCTDCGPTRLQTGLCVGVHCEGCTQTLTTPAGHPAHYPSETSARVAARGSGWRTGEGGRLYCPVCAPVLTCQAHGHEFGPWRLLPLTTEQDSPNQLVVRRATVTRPTVLVRAYRTCHRCCEHQSHGDWLTSQLLISGCVGPGKAPAGGVISTVVPERGVA